MTRRPLLEGSLTRAVIGAFYEVCNSLGHGFLEHLYPMALERELRERGHRVEREIGVRVSYKGEELGFQRLDMLVDGRLIVEVRSKHQLHRAATRQLYNHLHATNLEVGLLLHFGPEPKFYRLISTSPTPTKRDDPPDPASSATSGQPSSEGRPGRAGASPSDEG